MNKSNNKKFKILMIVMFSALAISIPSVILIKNRNDKDIKEVPTTVTASIEEEKDVDVGENNTSETVSEKKDNTTEKADKTDIKKDTSTEKTDTGNKKDKTTEVADNKADKTTENNNGQTNNSNNSNNSSTVASASNNNPVATTETTTTNNAIPTTTANNSNTTTENPKPTTTEAPKPTTTESPKPTTTEANKPSTTEATTEKAKVWHEPVYEQVWVVDFKGGDIPIIEYHTICNECGFDCTANGVRASSHLKDNENCHSYTTGVPVTVGYDHIDDVGHWENVLVSEGYWE